MTFHEFTNEFGGPSLLIGPGASLDDLYPPFAELITDEHRAAFADTAGYFGRLASEAPLEVMAVWLRHLAEADRCEIEINVHELCTAVIVKVKGFSVSLREPVELPPPGRVLDGLLYSIIRGNWELGYPNAGGLHGPRSVAEYGLRIHEDAKIPGDAVAFYTTSCGDSLVTVGETAYWYSHEITDVMPAGPTADVLSSYFRHLLDLGPLAGFNFPYENYQYRAHEP